MKSALFRKDGLGTAVGRLSASDKLKCDMGGTINEYQLIGNVVDTKDYDVVVFGWLRNDNTIEVIKWNRFPQMRIQMLDLCGRTRKMKRM